MSIENKLPVEARLEVASAHTENLLGRLRNGTPRRIGASALFIAITPASIGIFKAPEQDIRTYESRRIERVFVEAPEYEAVPTKEKNVIDDLADTAEQIMDNGTLPEFIPDNYRKDIIDASDTFNVSPEIMALIHTIEQKGNAFGVFEDGDWPESSTGAKGPAQFVNDTWKAYDSAINEGPLESDKKIDIPDIDNFRHSMFAMAKYLHEIGLSEAPTEAELRDVVVSYNAGPGTRKDEEGLWYYINNDHRVYWDSEKQQEINDYIDVSAQVYGEMLYGDYSFIEESMQSSEQ